MPLYFIEDELWFPPVHEALEDGLLAIGGDLSTERLLLAYRSGIFPWFNDDELPMWWCPDPRFVLIPEEVKVSKSMKQVMRNGGFELRVNTAFAQVITACQQTPREGQPGTWITEEVKNAYIRLHELGYAHSAEAWRDGSLVGGLYGVRLGKVFFGESMFSKVSNASKYAFISYAALLQSEGVELIDCQVHTEHLGRLGAKVISRESFIMLVDRLTSLTA